MFRLSGRTLGLVGFGNIARQVAVQSQIGAMLDVFKLITLSYAVMLPLLMIEQAFLAANIMKIPEGGWLPLVVAGMISLMVLTWVRGSRSLAKATGLSEKSVERRLD